MASKMQTLGKLKLILVGSQISILIHSPPRMNSSLSSKDKKKKVSLSPPSYVPAPAPAPAPVPAPAPPPPVRKHPLGHPCLKFYLYSGNLSRANHRLLCKNDFFVYLSSALADTLWKEIRLSPWNPELFHLWTNVHLPGSSFSSQILLCSQDCAPTFNGLWEFLLKIWVEMGISKEAFFLAGILWSLLSPSIKNAKTWRKLLIGCFSLGNKIQDDDPPSASSYLDLWRSELRGPAYPFFDTTLLLDLERFVLACLNFQTHITPEYYSAFLERIQMQVEDRDGLS